MPTLTCMTERAPTKHQKGLYIEINDGLIWSSVPRGIKGNFFLKLIRNYHFGDVNIFWKDILPKRSTGIEPAAGGGAVMVAAGPADAGPAEEEKTEFDVVLT